LLVPGFIIVVEGHFAPQFYSKKNPEINSNIQKDAKNFPKPIILAYF